MKVRNELLAGLQQYATLLAEGSGNDPIAEIDKQSEALGTQLQALSSDANLTTLTKNTSMDSGLVATAVDALGRALIEHKRASELPAILEKMQKPIEAPPPMRNGQVHPIARSRYSLRQLFKKFNRILQPKVPYLEYLDPFWEKRRPSFRRLFSRALQIAK